MPLIREDSPPRPISPYGASKVAGEALVSAYASKIKNAFCLRFFNIYGCYQRSEYSGVISRFAERLRRGLPLEIFGNGSQTRDFVHISDVVNAIILAKNYRLTHPCYTINIGTGEAVSVNALAKNMQKIFNAHSSSTVFKAPEGGSILHSCPDISNAKKILGYKTELRLKDGLTNMFMLESGHQMATAN